MKYIYKFFLIVCVVAFCGCQRSCSHLQREIQTSERDYHIEQYSGGRLIAVFDFHGMLNNESHSDGFYFTRNDTLIEISGDLIIKSR